MTNYIRLYTGFVEKQENVEILMGEPSSFLPPGCQAQTGESKISWLEFQQMLWEMRNANCIGDVIAACTSVNSAVTIMELLMEEGMVIISDNGRVEWIHSLFPKVGENGLDEDLFAYLDEVGLSFRCSPGLGQIRATLETSLRRARQMLKRLPPFGRSVLFIGDDDYTSIVLSRFIEGEIVVIDKDINVLKTIADASDRFGLNISVHEHDVLQKLPRHLIGRFDMVHFDPIDEGFWLGAWAETAEAALIKQKGSRMFVSVSPSRLGDRYISFQRFLVEKGYVFEDRILNCNEYPLTPDLPPFYRSFLDRKFQTKDLKSWLTQTPLAVYTDLLVFKRQIESWPMPLSNYLERRRSI